MSGLCQNRTHALQQTTYELHASFDHLVGEGEQLIRHSEADARSSIVTSWVSMMPASVKPFRKAFISDNGSGDPWCRNPITGSGCCARAASGRPENWPSRVRRPRSAAYRGRVGWRRSLHGSAMSPAVGS